MLKGAIFLAVLVAALLPFALRGPVAAWTALGLVGVAAVVGIIAIAMGEGE